MPKHCWPPQSTVVLCSPGLCIGHPVLTPPPAHIPAPLHPCNCDQSFVETHTRKRSARNARTKRKHTCIGEVEARHLGPTAVCYACVHCAASHRAAPHHAAPHRTALHCNAWLECQHTAREQARLPRAHAGTCGARAHMQARGVRVATVRRVCVGTPRTCRARACAPARRVCMLASMPWRSSVRPSTMQPALPTRPCVRTRIPQLHVHGVCAHAQGRRRGFLGKLQRILASRPQSPFARIDSANGTRTCARPRTRKTRTFLHSRIGGVYERTGSGRLTERARINACACMHAHTQVRADEHKRMGIRTHARANVHAHRRAGEGWQQGRQKKEAFS